MKTLKIIVLAVISILPLAAFGQSGKVTYKQIIDVHANLSPDQQALKAFIPESMESRKYFYADGSKGLLMKDEQKGNTTSTSSNVKTMSFSVSEDRFIFDYKEMKSYQLADILDGKFYVEYFLAQPEALSISNETKEILGYTCKKAVFTNSDTGDKQIIWFTNELDFRATPLGEIYIKEGAILELITPKVQYKATEISAEIDVTVPQTVPDGYRKITPEQYRDLKEEQVDRMKKNISNMKFPPKN